MTIGWYEAVDNRQVVAAELDGNCLLLDCAGVKLPFAVLLKSPNRVELICF